MHETTEFHAAKRVVAQILDNRTSVRVSNRERTPSVHAKSTTSICVRTEYADASLPQKGRMDRKTHTRTSQQRHLEALAPQGTCVLGKCSCMKLPAGG